MNASIMPQQQLCTKPHQAYVTQRTVTSPASQQMSQPIATPATHTPAALSAHQQSFRNAMSNLAAAVNIISTDGDAGRAGFTASAVCSVTDTPPTLLVCLNRNASVYETFKKNNVLCVNTLTQAHQVLSNLFGGKTPMQERFNHGTWETLVTGAPVLQDAIVSFDCKISNCMSVGTHDIFFCEVLGLKQTTGAQGLIYFNRAYHGLVQQP
jgi:flavin reductase